MNSDPTGADPAVPSDPQLEQQIRTHLNGWQPKAVKPWSQVLATVNPPTRWQVYPIAIAATVAVVLVSFAIFSAAHLGPFANQPVHLGISGH